MVPNFDLQGGAALVAARDAFVTPLLSAFGTIVFSAMVAPKLFGDMQPDLRAATTRRLRLLAQGSTAAALLGLCAWLLMQAATMADADSLGSTLAAAPAVLADTLFGHVVALQFAALAVLMLLLCAPPRAALGKVAMAVAMVAVALQAGHSHAFSMAEAPGLLLACDVAHLWGAGAWLGGLIPLLMVVRMSPPAIGALAARWFSPVGQACLWALLISAAYQGWVLVATIPGLVGTAYGWMVLVKLALFGVLFGFAWCNRYRFAPALRGGAPEAARGVLVRSIALQTGFALAILLAAVVLSQLPPAMHLQPLWPFAQRFSLTTIQEDPDFRLEVIEAGLALGAAALLVAGAVVLRRWRPAAGRAWPLAALAVALVVGWFAVPHLDLLMVPAYPTSFYHSPTGFTAATILNGRTVFAQNCTACHGATGHGDGPAAKSLPIPPADLTAAHLWMHEDGELFWWISHGMRSPEGAPAMPGFAATLDDDTIWAVIDYIRAHNAGTAYAATGMWPHTIQAPGFGLRCGGQAETLADLRGHYVHLLIGRLPNAAAPARVVTVVASPPAGTAVPAGVCVAADETVPAAYGVVSGLGTGAQFLIDDEGRLRAALGAGGEWDLRAEIDRLRAEPVMAPEVMDMNMKM
jgi:putative copper export protein/mono/diheme cytochrome c family protein